MHRDLDHGVLAVQLGHHPLDEGGRHGARDHIQLFGAVNAVGLVQLGHKFIFKQAHHAHTVFQLVKVLIELGGRDAAARFQVPLVAGVDDPLAVAALALIPKLFHDVDDLGAAGRIVGGLLEEVLAVIGNAAGHRRNALHHGSQLQQVGQGAAQLVAIVDTTAEHQLAVDRDAALHQPGQVLEHLSAPLIGQHPHPELGVGGVDRDVDGRNVHLDDAVDLMVLHVGHGDVVAKQERKALIIILKIKALPHPRRELVDEAEHAVVGAGMLLVAQIGGKIAAKGAALGALDVPLPDAVRHPCFQVKAFAVGIKIIVQRVVQLVLIHGQQLVTGQKAQCFGFAARFHTLDLDCHALTSQKQQEGEGVAPSPSVHNTNVPPILRKLALLDDFLALVVTAVATCLVGELQRAAVAALDQCGGLQLPNIAATLVAAGLGKMSLRYCHIFAPP